MSELMFALAGIFDTLVIAIYFCGIFKRNGHGVLMFQLVWCLQFGLLFHTFCPFIIYR